MTRSASRARGSPHTTQSAVHPRSASAASKTSSSPSPRGRAAHPASSTVGEPITPPSVGTPSTGRSQRAGVACCCSHLPGRRGGRRMRRGGSVREHGGPEVMAYSDVEVRQPGEGEILVDLAVAGVNFIDIYYRTGLYPADLPFTNGVEGAGVVSAVGPGVTGFAEGDRVAWTMTLGSYAEQVVVPTSAAVKVPDNVDLADAAAALLQGMTAHYLLHSVYAVQPGDAVLIHAAA